MEFQNLEKARYSVTSTASVNLFHLSHNRLLCNYGAKSANSLGKKSQFYTGKDRLW